MRCHAFPSSEKKGRVKNPTLDEEGTPLVLYIHSILNVFHFDTLFNEKAYNKQTDKATIETTALCASILTSNK